MLALAAAHHSVPFVVCAGLYKLTPLFPSGREEFNTLLAPQPLVGHEAGLQAVHAPKFV